MKRSELIWNLMSLLNDGVISRAELEGFSEELLEMLDYFLHWETPGYDSYCQK
ncbi:MAG: hypothetical protein ACI3VU_06560 [Faecousia sp.]